MRHIKVAAAISGLIVLAGCAGSDTAILFTTNNLGLNVQATPTPKAEITYSRQEGLIAPVFEDGNTVPASASVNHKIIPFLPISTDSGTVFAGGKAAQKLATDPADASGRPWVTCVSEQPKDFNNNPLPEKGKSRPMFFGTTTSIGFSVSLPPSNAVTMLPDVHLGYKRNEIAVVPLMGEPNSSDCKDPNRKYAIKSPEFLAVSSSGTSAPTMKDNQPTGGRFNVAQIFTTGRAAEAASHIDAVSGAFRAGLGISTETATTGTVTGTYDAKEPSAQCLDKWLKDGNGKLIAARVNDVAAWKKSKKLDADQLAFARDREHAASRSEFLKSKGETCA